MQTVNGQTDVIGLLAFLVVFVVLWAIVWAVLIGMSVSNGTSPFPFLSGVVAAPGTSSSPSSGQAAPQRVAAPAHAQAQTVQNIGPQTPAAAGTSGETEVVFVHAPWCGACKMNRPIWEQWRKSKGAQMVRTTEVNGDDHPSFVRENDIGYYPTVIAMRNGKKLQQFTDRMTADNLQAWMERIVKKK